MRPTCKRCATGWCQASTEKNASRPVSRVLYSPLPKLGRVTTIPLDHASPHGSRDQPERDARMRVPFDKLRACVPIRSCSRRGLPCPLPYGRGGGLLPHRFTITFEPKLSGRLFSVALSLRSLSAGVTRRRIRVEPGLSSNAAFRLYARGRPADWRDPCNPRSFRSPPASCARPPR
jgi:hypothetical protein